MTGLRYEVRVTADDLKSVERLLTAEPDCESAAFILAGEYRHGATVTLLGRRVVEIPSTEYRVRTRHRIELSPRAINGLVALCEASGLRPILCHSHPDDVPYSPSDDQGERRVAQTLEAFFPGHVMGSLLLTRRGFQGRVWLPPGSIRPLAAITAVGRTLSRVWIESDDQSPWQAASAEIHDRQIRAFGRAGQAILEATRVGVVGVGGTGSSLAEQLVRLGVRDLLLIDRDPVLEPSNLSRVYGSRYSDAHRSGWRGLFRRRPRSKVNIVRDHLHAINPEARIRALRADVTQANAARLLLDRDVIFACTDDHWGRSVLNQIAYQYLIPVINLGVAIDGQAGSIRGAVGVVQVLRPGLGCMWCGGYLSSERIRAESLAEDTRRDLEAEGYLRGIAESAPSVVTITTTVAGLAGTLFLQLVTDFMGPAGEVSRMNYLPLEGVAARGQVAPRTPCVCWKVKAKGDLEPLPVLPGDR